MGGDGVQVDVVATGADGIGDGANGVGLVPEALASEAGGAELILISSSISGGFDQAATELCSDMFSSTEYGEPSWVPEGERGGDLSDEILQGWLGELDR